MNKKTCVSIITVTYNLIENGRKDAFLRNIESVKNQTHKNIEHLIIDGGSTDGTVKLIESAGLKYISEKDNGIYEAMTKGAKFANGDILYFLNSDDYLYDKNVVETVLKAFKKTRADAICGNILPYVLDKDKQFAEIFKLGQIAKFKFIRNKNTLVVDNVHHQSIFYKKEIFSKASFFSGDIPNGSDWWFNCMAFLEHSCSCSYIDKTIACFSLGGYSSCSNINDTMSEYSELRKKIANKFDKYIDKKDPELIKYIKRKDLKKTRIKFLSCYLYKILENDYIKEIYLFGFLKIYHNDKKGITYV